MYRSTPMGFNNQKVDTAGVSYPTVVNGSISDLSAVTTPSAIVLLVDFSINGMVKHASEFSVSGNVITLTPPLESVYDGAPYKIIYY